MSKTLFVVESPNKAKCIRKYFPEFTVVATVGHFRDLPEKGIGVEEKTHKPLYETMSDKVAVEKQLRSAAKDAEVIILATDPDREGEAIAAHIANCLGDKYKSRMSRITYVEVSKKAILEALAKKRAIDWSLVRAQEARRVIDRYVGYLVSPVLSDKFRKIKASVPFLSAGRVQTVALKLVVERSAEIKDFKPVEHYGVVAKLVKNALGFCAVWQPAAGSGLMTDKALAETVKNRTDLLIAESVIKQRVLVPPPKPLTTSSYLKLISGRFKVTTKNAMSIAQKLFEQGLITYHRTDSPTMGEDFVAAIRRFATGLHLPLSDNVRTYKAKDNAQQGHECLRVTDIELPNVKLNDPLVEAVYHAIWQVTLASQLADAEDEKTTITWINRVKDIFSSVGKIQQKAGWRAITALKLKQNNNGGEPKREDAEAKISEDAEDHYGEDAVDTYSEDAAKNGGEKTAENQRLPIIQANEQWRPAAIELLIKFTKPPAFYNEKTLVEMLEKLGIGRPSTYATIIETIVNKSYVTREPKSLRLEPTTTGMAIVGALDNGFSFTEYAYTSALEKLFDQIAHRKIDYLTVVETAYQSIAAEIEDFSQLVLPGSTRTMIENIKAPVLKPVPAADVKTAAKKKAKPKKSLIG